MFPVGPFQNGNLWKGLKYARDGYINDIMLKLHVPGKKSESPPADDAFTKQSI